MKDYYYKKAAKTCDILFKFYVNRTDCEPTRTAILVHVIACNNMAKRFYRSIKLSEKYNELKNNV